MAWKKKEVFKQDIKRIKIIKEKTNKHVYIKIMNTK